MALLGQLIWYLFLFGSLFALFRVAYGRPLLAVARLAIPISAASALRSRPARSLAIGIGALGYLIRTPDHQAAHVRPDADRPDQPPCCSRSSWSSLGPLCEELAFRGFLHAAADPLARRRHAASLSPALIFGSLHAAEYQWSWRHVVLISTGRLHPGLGAPRHRVHRRLHVPALHLQPDSARSFLSSSPNRPWLKPFNGLTAGVVMIDQTKLAAPGGLRHLHGLPAKSPTAIRDMIIRGAPAIGVAAAMGVAIGMQTSRRCREFDTDLRNSGRHAAHRRQPVLGHRTHAPRVRAELAAPLARDIRAGLIAEAQQIRLRRHRHQPRHRPQRRPPGSRRQDRAHPLQCRRARHRGLRHRAGRDPGRRRVRQKHRRVRR